jgi:O-antigen/teichoic acid export membrane protein
LKNPEVSPDAPLKRRFLFKLASNLASVLIGVVSMAVVPRVLGPADYGRFEFISANFKLIVDSLSIGVPTAFFNWISCKGHKEDIDAAISVTFYFVCLIAVLFAAVLSLSMMTGWNSTLWPDLAPSYLWEAFGLVFAIFAFQFCTYLADGRAFTIGLEKIRLVQNIGKTGICLLLAWFGLLNLHAFFFLQISVVGLTALLTAVWLYRKSAFSLQAVKLWRFPRAEIGRYMKFLGEFIHPLIMLIAFGFVFGYFDRWFLQLIAGSSGYGYFGLSERLGGVAFIFTSAMTPLLTREFAFSFEENDRARLNQLFERIKIFLFIAAATSCFLSVNSGAIVQIIGGEKFKDAVVPIAIMALYPIHQTFGQLSAALLLATNQTKLYAKISILLLVISLPLAYLLMAPATFPLPGLGLGARGLAIKMVCINILVTNIQLFYNTRFLGVSFWKWVIVQLKIIGIIYSIAVAAHLVASLMPSRPFMFMDVFRIDRDLSSALLRVVVSGLIYMPSVVILLVAAPDLAGVKRDELRHFAENICRMLNNKWGAPRLALTKLTKGNKNE